MIEGIIESLTPAGVFTGWLRDGAHPAPPIVEMRCAGDIVARAAAMEFRRDLLRAGHGHGHYGFAARLAVALPPGPTPFELFLPRHGMALRARLVVPKLPALAPVAVEDLLRGAPGWTVEDVLAHLACLDLPAQCRRLGVPRFVDAAYRLALHRWPSNAEAAVYGRLLEAAELAPAQLLAELLTSRERRDLGGSVLSPWDPEFPFAPPAAADHMES